MTVIYTELNGRCGNMIKLMSFLIGSGTGFGISEKIIQERCGMSQSHYIEAREALCNDYQWLEVKDGKITILYGNIHKLAPEEREAITLRKVAREEARKKQKVKEPKSVIVGEYDNGFDF